MTKQFRILTELGSMAEIVATTEGPTLHLEPNPFYKADLREVEKYIYTVHDIIYPKVWTLFVNIYMNNFRDQQLPKELAEFRLY